MTEVRIGAWNLNHRARRKVIPRSIEQAIGVLDVDVLVLTEFVDGPGRGWFRDSLDRLGLGHQVVSHSSAPHNQVLIAASTPVYIGDLTPPRFDAPAHSNFLHVVLEGRGLELIGLRVPAYRRGSDRRGYGEALSLALEDVARRSVVVAGDFNMDPFRGAARHDLQQTTWEVAPGLWVENPIGEWSYCNHSGSATTRIDHVAHTASVTVTDAEYLSVAGGCTLAGPKASDPISDHAALVFTVSIHA